MSGNAKLDTVARVSLPLARLFYVAIAVTACSFDTSTVATMRDAKWADDAGTIWDAAPPRADAGPPKTCDSSRSELVLCMRFEESEQSMMLRDESQYDNHGTVSEATFPEGHDGKVLRPDSVFFDSNIPPSQSLNLSEAMTLEMWIRPDDVLIFGRVGLVDNDGRYGLFLGDEYELQCGVSIGEKVVTSDDVVTQGGGWQHVACTYDGATVRVFVDGVEKAAEARSGPIGSVQSTGTSVAQNSPGGDVFEGAVDTLRIWNIARTRRQLCDGAGLDCL